MVSEQTRILEATLVNVSLKDRPYVLALIAIVQNLEGINNSLKLIANSSADGR